MYIQIDLKRHLDLFAFPKLLSKFGEPADDDVGPSHIYSIYLFTQKNTVELTIEKE